MIFRKDAKASHPLHKVIHPDHPEWENNKVCYGSKIPSMVYFSSEIVYHIFHQVCKYIMDNSLSHSSCIYVCWFFFGGIIYLIVFRISTLSHCFAHFGSLNLVFSFKLNPILIQNMPLLCCLNLAKPLECRIDCTGEFELDDISSHVQIFIHIV